MVSEGELIPLEQLIHDYENFTKLRKIHFFKYYPLLKMIGKWYRGSTVTRFVHNKRSITKLLHLENPKVLAWKLKLKDMLVVEEAEGQMGGGWVQKILDEITDNNHRVRE